MFCSELQPQILHVDFLNFLKTESLHEKNTASHSLSLLMDPGGQTH